MNSLFDDIDEDTDPRLPSPPFTFSVQQPTKREREEHGEHAFKMATPNYSVARPLAEMLQHIFGHSDKVEVVMPRENGSVVFVEVDSNLVRPSVRGYLNQIQDDDA